MVEAAMAYTADTLAYDVISEMGPRELKGPVWILGHKYIFPRDKDAMTDDVRSRIWCTYRRSFRPISGTNLSSDNGWGCTLRCGQMLLAHTLLCKKFGRDYRWIQGYSDPPYVDILRKFLDIRDSEYSIQMIALQGADFGRQVGQWFGPNNVAQAIKKLAAYDTQSQLAVHVAMDMLVVIDDLKALAREPHSLPNSPINVTDEKGEELPLKIRSQTSAVCSPSPVDTDDLRPHSSSLGTDSLQREPDAGPSTSPRGEMAVHPDPIAMSSPFNMKSPPIVAKTEASSSGRTYFSPELTTAKQLVMGDESLDFMKLSLCAPPMSQPVSSPVYVEDTHLRPTPAARVLSASGKSEVFRSILLFIPLRLGQDTFNPSYSEALKACLTLPQSVGFIGGRPRHALYFIGYNENTLLFLDPHTTQPTVQMKDDGSFPDSSYHTVNYGRMNMSSLDPSVALGFFCKDENDLDDLVKHLKRVVLRDNCLNMFELTEHRPSYWGPFEATTMHTSIKEPFILVNGGQTSEDSDDEDFEIIDWPPQMHSSLVSAPRFRATPLSPSRDGDGRGIKMSSFDNLTNPIN